MEGVPHRYHDDHITGKGMNSLSVHNFNPMPQAMKIPHAKAAVEKEWGKLEKLPAWQLTKVRNKKEVIAEERTENRTVHFESLMDLCHLKNSELEPQFQKCKGRAVLRGDIVKDDSGSHAVLTEQGLSASQMTAAKIMDIISRLPGCAGQVADGVSAYTQVKNGRCTDVIENSKVRMPRSLDTSNITEMAQITVQYGRSCRSFRAKSVRSSFGRTVMVKKFQNVNAYSLTEEKGYSCLCMWTR